MAKQGHRSPTRLALQHNIGNDRLGAGKDNRVYPIEIVDPGLRARIGDYVLKIGTTLPNRKKELYSSETAHNDLRFKQEKYRLLHTFLGDNIPTSAFFVGSQRNPDGSIVIKPYTVQRRVANVTLGALTPEQRNSDTLRGNMYSLVKRLQNMYTALDQARHIVEGQGDKFLVDAALDLGPFSDYVREHTYEDAGRFNYKHMMTGYKDSPNLLVDPETLNVSCVDFGSGEWNDLLGAQLGLVYDIANHNDAIRSQLPATPVNQ